MPIFQIPGWRPAYGAPQTSTSDPVLEERARPKITDGMSHATARATAYGGNPLKLLVAAVATFAASTGAAITPNWAVPGVRPDDNWPGMTSSFLKSLNLEKVLVAEDTAHRQQDCRVYTLAVEAARGDGPEDGQRGRSIFVHEAQDRAAYELIEHYARVQADWVCGTDAATQSDSTRLLQDLTGLPRAHEEAYSFKVDNSTGWHKARYDRSTNVVLRCALGSVISLQVSRPPGDEIIRHQCSDEQILVYDLAPHLNDASAAAKWGAFYTMQATSPTALLAGNLIVNEKLPGPKLNEFFECVLGMGFGVAILPVEQGVPIEDSSLLAVVPMTPQAREQFEKLASDNRGLARVMLPTPEAMASFQHAPPRPPLERPPLSGSGGRTAAIASGMVGLAGLGVYVLLNRRRPKTVESEAAQAAKVPLTRKQRQELNRLRDEAAAAQAEQRRLQNQPQETEPAGAKPAEAGPVYAKPAASKPAHTALEPDTPPSIKSLKTSEERQELHRRIRDEKAAKVEMAKRKQAAALERQLNEEQIQAVAAFLAPAWHPSRFPQLLDSLVLEEAGEAPPDHGASNSEKIDDLLNLKADFVDEKFRNFATARRILQSYGVTARPGKDAHLICHWGEWTAEFARGGLEGKYPELEIARIKKFFIQCIDHEINVLLDTPHPLEAERKAR